MRAGAESFSRTNRGGADCGMQFRGAGAAWARICYAKPIMLVRLEVRNLAVVEAAEALFGPGLNVITGSSAWIKGVTLTFSASNSMRMTFYLVYLKDKASLNSNYPYRLGVFTL